MDYGKLLHVKIETTPEEILRAGADAMTEVSIENPLAAVFLDEIAKVIALTARKLSDKKFKEGER